MENKGRAQKRERENGGKWEVDSQTKCEICTPSPQQRTAQHSESGKTEGILIIINNNNTTPHHTDKMKGGNLKEEHSESKKIYNENEMNANYHLIMQT